MRRRETIMLGVMAILAAVSLYLGMTATLLADPLSGRIASSAALFMVIELLIVLGWSYWCFLGKSLLRRAGAAAVVLLFSWLHEAFLPVVVSGGYLLYILLIGKGFRRQLMTKKGGPTEPDLFADLVFGSAIWIVMVCALSAVGRGGIPVLQMVAIITAIPLFAYEGTRLRKWTPAVIDRKQAFLMAVVLTMLLMQVGRMNIAMDYDSLHYGLRTPFILNNGNGIYENLGNINLVYTYSKGLETLAMALPQGSTYGYVLAFNIWITAGVLAVVYAITKQAAGKLSGWLAAAVTACIPGIMNMAITAKTDNITLLYQLCFLYFLIRCGQQKDREGTTKYFVYAGCGCLMTFLFKPTALVFGTVAYAAGLLFLLVNQRLFLKAKSRWWIGVVPCALALLGMWTRTLLLTGVPVTSVFTSAFQALGFQVKPPFAFSDIPNNGSGLGFIKELQFLLSRIAKICFSPTGEDMGHVVIAWGTPIIIFLMTVLVVTAGRKLWNDQKSRQQERLLYVIYIPLVFVSIISIRMLWQVDGNYFVLLYAMTVILAVTALKESTDQLLKKGVYRLLVPMVLFCAAVTCFTNWSGIVGFSPIRLVNSGYYDHRTETYEQKAEAGNEEIWKLLSADPKTRVIAFGEHPQVLSFPCNVQSYYDVTGSGGNVVLVKTLDNFKGFLRYAKTDYIYVQAGYLKSGSRAYDVVRYLIEDGSLTNLKFEHGNMLGEVNLDGTLPVKGDQG